MDSVLDKTITIFRFLADKDVFERYYKGHLAKRLLHGRSVSDDAERGMLAKLKVECGYQFTQKLEGMFHDMKISSETMQAYHNHLATTTVRIWPLRLSCRTAHPVAGPGGRGLRHRHDVDVLAHVTLSLAVQFPGGTAQGGQVIRAVLPVPPFWQAADVAALTWQCGCPRQVQLAKT